MTEGVNLLQLLERTYYNIWWWYSLPFLVQNLKSDLSLWQLGTLPPGLIAFHGNVHAIDPFWHMLGLGYQDNTSIADAKSAGVIHFNGRAKPWLDIAFPQLRSLWTKYVNFSDKFIRTCHIRATWNEARDLLTMLLVIKKQNFERGEACIEGLSTPWREIGNSSRAWHSWTPQSYYNFWFTQCIIQCTWWIFPLNNTCKDNKKGYSSNSIYVS